MKELVKIKEVEIYDPIFDLVGSDAFMVSRTDENLIAIDLNTYETKWVANISGRDRMGIDFVFMTDNSYFLIFSYNKPDKNFFVALYDENGKQKWESILQYRPKFKESLVEKNGFIFFNGYKVEGGIGGVYSIKVRTGEIKLVTQLDIKSKIMTLNKEGFVITASDAIVSYDEVSGIDRILDNLYIEYSIEINKSIISISQSDVLGKYNVFKLNLNDDVLNIQQCGIIEMDDKDRQYMEPFAYDENTLIIYDGKHKGISCYSLSDKKILWSSGKDKWTCLDILKLKGKLIIHTENLDDNASLLVYDICGNFIEIVKTDVYPEIIHTCQDRLFVSSYDGLEIFRLK